MLTIHSDTLTEFEILSKIIEEAKGITKNSLDAYTTYLNLLTIREQLAVVRRSYSKLQH